MDQTAFKESIKRKASRRHLETVDEINMLLQQLVEPAAKHSEQRAHPRYPVCVRLRVTPYSDALSALGSPQVAYSQNLSVSGAALLLAEDPEADYLRVDFANGTSPLTLILRILWKRQSGSFTEAGGSFVARI